MNALNPAPILVDQVYESLISAIAEHRLRPGERIRQDKLAASLGVSRQPVSHALQLLKYQGLVRESGRQGLEVTPLDPDRIHHLYAARASLDELAARLAAARAAASDLSASEFAFLSHVAERGSEEDATQPRSALSQADVEFHQAIYRMSGNPVILELITPQWPHLRRSMTIFLADPDYCTRIAHEHAEISRLILTGDEAGAASAARHHATVAGEETALRLRQKPA